MSHDQHYLTTRASHVSDAAIAPTALTSPSLAPHLPRLASRRFGPGRTNCILLTMAGRTLEIRGTMLLALKVSEQQEETQRRLAAGFLSRSQEVKSDSVITADDESFLHVVSLLKYQKSSSSQQGQSLRK